MGRGAGCPGRRGPKDSSFSVGKGASGGRWPAGGQSPLSHLPVPQAADAVGEILLSLSYLPTAERLTVVVVKAKNLIWTGDKTTAGEAPPAACSSGGWWDPGAGC